MKLFLKLFLKRVSCFKTGHHDAIKTVKILASGEANFQLLFCINTHCYTPSYNVRYALNVCIQSYHHEIKDLTKNIFFKQGSQVITGVN